MICLLTFIQNYVASTFEATHRPRPHIRGQDWALLADCTTPSGLLHTREKDGNCRFCGSAGVFGAKHTEMQKERGALEAVRHCRGKQFELKMSQKLTSKAVKISRGGYLRPKMGIIFHAPRAGGPNWQVSSSALLCRFHAAKPVRATCLSSRGINLTYW